MAKFFGTSGIRGHGENFFTDSLCSQIAISFHQFLLNNSYPGPIAIGNDPRGSSPRIKRAIISGLNLKKREVFDQGSTSTPAMCNVLLDSAYSASIMVTGSHIASELNGIKFFFNKEEILKKHEVEIEKILSQTSPPNQPQGLLEYHITNLAAQTYIERLVTLNESSVRLKIVVDCGNGSQSDLMPEVLRRIGHQVIEMNCSIQGEFMARDTEVDGILANLQQSVLESRADLGIAYDADGDRAAFVDHTGRFISGDYIGTILAKNLSSPAIVTTIGTSQVIDTIGKKVFRTKVGSPYVITKMKEEKSTFGFEPNGGCIFPEVMVTRDGGTTTIQLLNVLYKNHTTLAESFDQLPRFFMYKNKLDCPAHLFPEILSEAKKKFPGNADETDGLKVWLTNSEWLLFRPSGNAPEFRVFCESPDEKQAENLGKRAIDLVKSYLTPHDSLNIQASIHSLPDQIDQVIYEVSTLSIPPECHLVDNIVVSGMGGSALGGRIIKSLERSVLSIPLTISTDYHLPAFVNHKSLIIISSYSGDTEETLSSLAEARTRHAQIFAITSGGKLTALIDEYKLPAYVFDPKHNPSGQPRMGIGYNLVSLLALLSRCQLIKPQDLSGLPNFLRNRQSSINYELYTKNLIGKIPVIVAAEHLIGAAHNIRNQIHENAKCFAVIFDFPELNHHLLEGLRFPDSLSSHLSFLFLESNLYSSQTNNAYSLTKEVIQKQKFEVGSFRPVGGSALYEVMDVIQFGAMLAFELSQSYSIDPGPIPWVDWLKDQKRLP